jgi:hypothetical protein
MVTIDFSLPAPDRLFQLMESDPSRILAGFKWLTRQSNLEMAVRARHDLYL